MKQDETMTGVWANMKINAGGKTKALNMEEP